MRARDIYIREFISKIPHFDHSYDQEATMVLQERWNCLSFTTLEKYFADENSSLDDDETFCYQFFLRIKEKINLDKYSFRYFKVLYGYLTKAFIKELYDGSEKEITTKYIYYFCEPFEDNVHYQWISKQMSDFLEDYKKKIV